MKRMATDMTPVLENPSMASSGVMILKTSMAVRPSNIATGVATALVTNRERVTDRIANDTQASHLMVSNAKIPNIAKPKASTNKNTKIPQLSRRKRKATRRDAPASPNSSRRSENVGRSLDGLTKYGLSTLVLDLGFGNGGGSTSFPFALILFVLLFPERCR